MNKLIIFPLLAVLLSSCNGSNNRVRVVKGCKLYESTYYIKDFDVYFFDNKDIPYVDLLTTIKGYFNVWDYKKIDNSKISVSNYYGPSFTLNLETTEIVYDNFDLLLHGKPIKEDREIYDLLYVNLVPCKKINEESEFIKGKTYSIKLSDFGFKFEKYNNNYYTPIDVISTMCGANQSYYYENKLLCALPIEYEGLKEQLSFNHKFSNSYYEHCFNIFMLQQEIRSGLKGITRKYLSNGEYHTYFEKGVLNTLLPYKDKIINSKSIEEFDKGMMEMMKIELNSGGHDNVGSRSFNSTQAYLYASEYDFIDYGEIDVKNERKKSKDANDFSKCVYAYDSDNDGKKDIGYITFNRFLIDTIKNDDGSIDYGMKDILLGNNGANEIFNPNSKTYDSTKYDIKDIVIDLSANGGGAIETETILSAWLCGGKLQEACRNPNTGSYNKISYEYDINQDGLYNNQDYLPNNINIYILTSNSSYSAANELPFHCYCYNKNNNPTNKIKFIGARPGGGCCAILGPFYLATGFGFYQSFNCAICDYNDVNISSETEIKITDGFELTIAQMVDRTGTNGLNKLISSKRK